MIMGETESWLRSLNAAEIMERGLSVSSVLDISDSLGAEN